MSKKPQYDPEEIRYPNQKIEISPLVPEMEQSYIEYAMSVIVGRALPDVRDGLKPVHRRILYAMYEDNLTSDKPFKKSATCVGDVLGRYHPHGDQSVYDALVRLAQDFSMRYMLVDGHGNFGSVDGDPPAAYRYTEARLSKLSDEMLRDIEKDTVDWDPNFDETRKEPKVLPSRFPNLLVNGSQGIAVGMATNIPPHNLREVVSGMIALIDDPEIDLAGLMEHIKGPDFPTGGVIMGRSGIRAAYATGRGKITLRGRAEIVEKKIANMGAMGMLGVDVEGKTVETGDGLRMGAWIGAKVQDFHAPMTHHMGSGMGVTPFLQINKRGDRFMNECIPGQQLENQIELQPECTSFQLYDSKWGEEVPYMPANHGGLCYIIPEDEDESNPNYTDRQYTKISAKAEAYQFKADTLEDLLTQCGFEGDALDNALASVERYNELAKAGSDDDFGKPASRMFALENPPYYACQWGTTSMLVCVGGLESDENCHTFTEEDPASPKRDIIKGLYVCGNVQGSRYAVEYPICMRGISHSLCVYYGYIAGKNCVAGV